MPFDETLLEPAGGFDEALLEPVEPKVPAYEITAPISVEPYVPPASQEEQLGNVLAAVPVTAPGITPPLPFIPPKQFATESLLPMPFLPTPEQKPITIPERAFAMASPFPGAAAVTAALGPDVTAAMNRRAANIVPEMWNFLTSPVGAATAGLASLPSTVVKTLVSLGFSGDMAYNLFNQVKQASKDWPSLSWQQRGERIMDAAKTAAMAAVTGVHGAKGVAGMVKGKAAAVPPEKPPIIEQPPPLPEESAKLLPQSARVLMEQESEKPREVKVEDYVPEQPTEVVVKAEQLAPAAPVPTEPTTPPVEAATIAPKTEAAAGALKVYRVWRGDTEPISEFSREKLIDKVGFFFDPEISVAGKHGNPKAYDVTISNPYLAKNRSDPNIDTAESKGFDGVIIQTTGEIIAFKPEQIKLAAPAAPSPRLEPPEIVQARQLVAEHEASLAAEKNADARYGQLVRKKNRTGAEEQEMNDLWATLEKAEQEGEGISAGLADEVYRDAKRLIADYEKQPAAPAAQLGTGGPSAIPKRETTAVPVEVPPGHRPTLEPQVRQQAAAKEVPKGPAGPPGPAQGDVLLAPAAAPAAAQAASSMSKPDYVKSAEDAAQAAYEKLGSAEKGAYDKSKRKGMTKTQLSKLDIFDLYVAVEAEAKKRWKASKPVVQAPSPAPPAGQVGQLGMGLTEGPGATALGAPAAGGKSQIEQLSDAFAAKAPSRDRAAQLVRESFDFGHRAGAARDILSRALGALKSSTDAVWTALTKFDKPDQLLQAKGSLSAELETRGWRVRQFAKNVRKAIPDKRRRAAIAKWVDAGGDDARLALGEAATKPEFRQAYRDARNLSAEDKIAAQNIQNYFESRLQEAIDADVLEAGLEDYIHRIYQNDPATRQRALAYVQSGILTKNPSLAKKRFYEFDYEAEAMGRRPVQDFLPRLTDYETSLSKAIAARKFIGQLTQMTAPDGRPIVGIKGLGLPVEDQAGVRTGTVIKPLGDFRKNSIPGTPDYRGDYKTKEYPSLSRWKWIGQDTDGKPIFMQGPVAIHPDYIDRVEALLEPSHVRYGSNEKLSKIGRGALGASSVFKQTMLDLSGFHQVQIAIHAMEHRVMPWRIVKDIDFADPKVEGLLKGGVTLGGDYHDANFGEGLFGKSLTQHVPILGPIAESYHNWLFQSFIPRVKMTMALHALERNRTRYSKDLATRRMTEQDLNFLTAKQANAAFGELNYTMLERNKTIQDLARLTLLAPDFLEARGRFVAQALTKYGTEQRVALLLGAVTMYTLARIMNKIVDDQYHFEPENAFSIVHGNHSYSLRTVQGDVLHLIDQPIRFWLNRLNPLYTRTILEAVTQRDVFGRKRTATEIALDTIKNIQPIATRFSRERSLWESVANSFGLAAKRWNDVDKAFKLAGDWKKANGIQERGEFIYDPDKDPLRTLKLALNDNDEAAAASEIQRLFRDRVMPKAKLDAYFQRFAKMPFTGSLANDNRFLATLTEDQRKTVANARKHRYKIGMAYRDAMSKYVELVNKPPQ